MRFLLAALLAALPALAQQRDPLIVPDIPGYHTLKCDLHMHTVFSDGEVWPTTRVTEAWHDGLDAIAITDHAGYNPHKEDLKPDLGRPYAIARPLADSVGLILVPGVEVAEGNFHCNALFVTDFNAFTGLKMAEALEVAHKQGAYVFWNHPGWKETPNWAPPASTLHERSLIQGFEVVNHTSYYPEAFPWAKEHQMPMFANSDIHTPIQAIYAPRRRPVTLVFARTPDLAGIKDALLARRTVAWYDGQMWGEEEYLRQLWAGAVRTKDESLSVPAGGRCGLILQNHSAIPFQIRVVKSPVWLRGRNVDLAPDGIAGMVIGVAKDAPAGSQRVDLELEVTNLHVAPGQNLAVKLPLQIEVSK